MLFDVIVAGWQETFRSTASRLADLTVSCQPAGRRHFLKKLHLFFSVLQFMCIPSANYFERQGFVITFRKMLQ